MSLLEEKKESVPGALLEPTPAQLPLTAPMPMPMGEPTAEQVPRPRSLYSAYSYQQDEVPSEETYAQRFNDLVKLLPEEQWPPQLVPPVAPLWRPPRALLAKPYAFYPPEGIPAVAGDAYPDTWREPDLVESGPGVGAAVATPYGTMSLRLRERVRVEMTIDQAIRITNFKSNIVLSLSSSGSAAALLHPNGRVYQYGSRVEIMANDSNGNNKLAKMWYKGVSFTSEQCALVYLVDAAGTRTTTDVFSDMSGDFSLPVFYNESCHGFSCVQDCMDALQAAQYWLTDEGIHHWMINNVHVSQTQDGLVRVARYSNKYQLRTSPANGTASLTTPFVHCTASLGQTSHLFVKRGERRMHYDGCSFIVRNAGHSAGFDDKNQLKVY